VQNCRKVDVNEGNLVHLVAGKWERINRELNEKRTSSPVVLKRMAMGARLTGGGKFRPKVKEMNGLKIHSEGLLRRAYLLYKCGGGGLRREKKPGK